MQEILDFLLKVLLTIEKEIIGISNIYKRIFSFDFDKAFENYYSVALFISSLILLIFSILYLYKKAYTIIGFFATKKFPKAKKNHKYAILIPARNERDVIGNLLDSIKKQDYDMSLVDVFVIADNCTDDTADIARKNGAIVYERFDNEHRTKGYALQFLFEQIRKDYGILNYEAYFIFDSDNLLKRDYITRMNEAFDSGKKIVTSYRNTKNLDENWIASTYAFHWLRSIRCNHRARSVLNLATNIQGTGFMFTSEIVKNGWKYVSLTEDRALTADVVKEGYEISYCDAAEFYDEQPTSIKIALRQRVRWAKGHIQAFFESGPGLFKHIFYTGGVANKNTQNGKFKRFFNNIRLRFMSFDMLLQIFPRAVFSLFRLLILLILQVFFYITTHNFCTIVFVWFLWESRILGYYIPTYIKNICYAIYVWIVERKRIKKVNFFKMLFYCFTYPTFDIIGIWSLYVAIFKKVEWKPIPHKSTVDIDELSQNIEGEQK